jgi:hypothetical protein
MESLRIGLEGDAQESVTTSTGDEPIATDGLEPASQEPPSPPPLRARLPWKTLTGLTLGVALLVIMAEISRLSGSMLDRIGQAWSFNEPAGWPGQPY